MTLSTRAIEMIKANPNAEALYRRMYDDAITQLALCPEGEDGARALTAVVFRVPFEQVISDERAKMKAIAEGEAFYNEHDEHDTDKPISEHDHLMWANRGADWLKGNKR